MFQSAQMVSYRVPDLARAKQWYQAALGCAPAFDSPLAVVFTAGTSTLVLLPTGDVTRDDERGLTYWTVDDIEAAYKRLIESGASSRAEIGLLMMRQRVAKVVDPFGNVLGLISNADKRRSADARPSESALTVALCRALAAHETRDALRGPDKLAELFLSDEARRSLDAPAARTWLLEKMAALYYYLLARTAYLDRAVETALAEGVAQVVLLGAGYDTRAHRLAPLIGPARVFEVDVAPTQRRKRQILEQAAVATPPQLVYVSINFEKEGLADVLDDAGFDRQKRTLWIWEGVTYYLSAQAVDVTLEVIRKQSPSGSALCFDYLVQAPDMESRPGVKEMLAGWRAAYSSEPVQFGIEEGTIGAFLSAHGYQLAEHLSSQDLERRYLLLPDGSLPGRILPIFSLVQARVIA
jgi:methyltransferase (TIGR00027 family)